LPTSAEFQGVASIGYTQPIGASRSLFVNFTVQHVGSSFSQFENEVPNFDPRIEFVLQLNESRKLSAACLAPTPLVCPWFHGSACRW
jgi:hypothetical protein